MKQYAWKALLRNKGWLYHSQGWEAFDLRNLNPATFPRQRGFKKT
jgi:hypothetical protein